MCHQVKIAPYGERFAWTSSMPHIAATASAFTKLKEGLARRAWSFRAAFIAASALWALATTQVLAQESRPEAGIGPETATTRVADEQVIVRGRRLSELEFNIHDYIREFVAEVAAPAQGRGLARWNDSVCIGVNNLERNSAQYIVDRISYQATELGLSIGEPGCHPDVVIIFAANAKELATFLVENNRGAFRPSSSVGSMSRSRKELARISHQKDG